MSAFETLQSTFTGQFTNNQAAVDAAEIRYNYMIMAHNAYVEGNVQLGNAYWAQAAYYEKLRNIAMANANKKD